MLKIIIERASSVPLYVQLKEGIKNLIIKGLSDHGQDVEADKIMETDFPTFTTDDTVKDVYEKLQLSGTKIAPVFENDVLIGVIDIKNIHEYLLVFEALNTRKWL